MSPAETLPVLVQNSLQTPTIKEPTRLTTLSEAIQGFLAQYVPSTRDAYQVDLRSWLTFCEGVNQDPLTAGFHHADVFHRLLREHGDPYTGNRLSPATIARRLSATSSFYVYCVRQRLITARRGSRR